MMMHGLANFKFAIVFVYRVLRTGVLNRI